MEITDSAVPDEFKDIFLNHQSEALNKTLYLIQEKESMTTDLFAALLQTLLAKVNDLYASWINFEETFPSSKCLLLISVIFLNFS